MDTPSFPELNRVGRGHTFYPTGDIPMLYATEDIPLNDKTVYARYFARNGAGTWWLMEHDPVSHEGFGFAEISNREAGYFDLVALESLSVPRSDGLIIIIERDLDWVPVRWGDIEHE